MIVKLTKDNRTILLKTVRTTNVLGAAGGGTLIYQEGGTSQGPVVFNDWSDLYARLQALRAAGNGGGIYPLAIDDRYASGLEGGCNVPPSSTPYDMSGVTLVSYDKINGGDSVLNFLEGSSVINLRSISDFLTVNNLNTLAPLEVFPAGIEWHLVKIQAGSSVQTVAGGAPAWDCSQMSPGGGVILKIADNAYLSGNKPGTVLGNIPANVAMVGISQGGNPIHPPFGRYAAITADLGSFVQLQMDNPSQHPKLPLVLGTKLPPQTANGMTTIPNPWLGLSATSGVTARFGDFIRIDASGGQVTQVLPRASGDVLGVGGFVSIAETGGGSILVQPGAGDTIIGGQSISIPPNGGALLQYDGAGTWSVIGAQGQSSPTAVPSTVSLSLGAWDSHESSTPLVVSQVSIDPDSFSSPGSTQTIQFRAVAANVGGVASTNVGLFLVSGVMIATLNFTNASPTLAFVDVTLPSGSVVYETRIWVDAPDLIDDAIALGSAELRITNTPN